MKSNRVLSAGALALLTIIVLTGCSDKKSNPLASFQPEIINNADAFQFQATGTSHVTTVVEYPWNNTGTQAKVNHSSAVTAGNASVALFDADSVQVYTDQLSASASGTSSTGKAGTWYVKVTLIDVSGTLNFRVEKM